MILYKIIRPMLYIWFMIVYKPQIFNKENIPFKGSVILAGNHTSSLDCFALGACTKRCIRYVAKAELMKGIKGFFFKGIGIIPVNRKIHDKSVIPSCVKYLSKGEALGIFPEGTINRTKNIIISFKKGVVVMANQSNSPIIPFAINGEYKRGRLKIIFGKPYYPSTKDTEKEIKILEDKVVKLIDSLGEVL